VFREKKPKDHYFKHYNLQLHALQFQNLQISTVLMEKENMFFITRVLLHDVILHQLKGFMQGSNLVGFECK
jgi:hypothetical protein